VVVVGLPAPGVRGEHVQLVTLGKGRAAAVVRGVPHVATGDAAEVPVFGAIALERGDEGGGFVVVGRVREGRAIPGGGGDRLALEFGQVEQGRLTGHFDYLQQYY